MCDYTFVVVEMCTACAWVGPQLSTALHLHSKAYRTTVQQVLYYHSTLHYCALLSY